MLAIVIRWLRQGQQMTHYWQTEGPGTSVCSGRRHDEENYGMNSWRTDTHVSDKRVNILHNKHTSNISEPIDFWLSYAAKRAMPKLKALNSLHKLNYMSL
jgi:hypothetical protein